MKNFNAERTFGALVDWCADLIQREKAPGLMVGISGTDSILAFMICARAFERLGRADRVVGVHYGAPFPPPDRNEAQIARILSASPSYRWVQRIIVPWLKDQAPDASVVTDDSIDVRDDYARWAALFHRSINFAKASEAYNAVNSFWVCGTRNATEEALSAYSNISGAVSLQPIIGLWKTEVLAICEWLGVPAIAAEHSRQVDCNCGRFDLAAEHISEIDLILRARAGQVDWQEVSGQIDSDLLSRLIAFIDEQIAYAGFKKRIPYRPPLFA